MLKTRFLLYRTRLNRVESFLNIGTKMETYLAVILTIIVLLVLLALIGLHIYIKHFSRKNNGSYACLVGKTVIVTGANTGAGYYTALNFAMRGARVIMACRNREKGEDARKSITEMTNNPNVVLHLIDMESLASVRRFAKAVNESEERLDILVNNIGAYGLGKDLSEDNLLKTAQVNYFSVFLLTHLLLDKLKRSSPARIVNVASIASAFASVQAENMNAYPKIRIKMLAEFWTYIKAKLCLVLFTLELARKLEGTGVTVNALHPGLVNSQMWNYAPFYRFLMKHAPFVNFLSAEEGAQTSIYVSVSKDVKIATGKIYHNCQETAVYKNARSELLAHQIWENSEELVHLSEQEKVKNPVNIV